MGRKAVTLGVSQKLGTGYSWLLEERNRGTARAACGSRSFITPSSSCRELTRAEMAAPSTDPQLHQLISCQLYRLASGVENPEINKQQSLSLMLMPGQ